MLEFWKTDLINFYKTRGAQEVVKSIKENNIVMIIGNSGTGKSTTMKYTTLQLREEGYEIIILSDPNDIPSQRFINRKQLFIMDDVLGKYRIDSMAFGMWERLHDRLKVVFNDKSAKLLVTLRRQLHKTIRQVQPFLIFDSKVVDLDSNDLVLSKDEKIAMLEKYLENKNLTNIMTSNEKSVMCTCNIAFPLLCSVFSSNQDFWKQKAKLFQSPTVVFKRELDRFQKENAEVYCVLVLLLMFSFRELTSLFIIKCEFERIDVYRSVLSACGVSGNISRKVLQDHLQSLSGTFVEPSNHFKFIHDTLEDTIARHFGSNFPDVMLKCCKLQFIRDKVRFKKLPADDDDILILNSLSYDALSQRILKEIRSGEFWDVLVCEPMQDEQFIYHFVSYVIKNHVTFQWLGSLKCKENVLSSHYEVASNAKENSLAKRFSLMEVLQSRKKLFIHWVAAFGSLSLFKAIFEGQKSKLRQMYDKHTVLTTLLHLAVLGENFDVINLLIGMGANLKSYDEYGIPLLCKLASTNRCDIAELLINSGADVNQCDQMKGWTPCCVASWFNEAEMLKLLISRGASVNEMDFAGTVPLILAIMKNNAHIVSVLLNHGAEIFNYIYDYTYFKIECSTDFNFALQIALKRQDDEIVKLLTNSGKCRNDIVVYFPVLNQKMCNFTILLKTVDLFLNELKVENSESALWNDFIAACSAVRTNDCSSLNQIFEKSDSIEMYSFSRGALINNANRKEKLVKFNQNYLRFSLLHVAVVCDNVDAAKQLIKYGGNPFQRDRLERTSLHLANSSEMLRVLLSTQINPDSRSQLSAGRVLKLCFSFKFIHIIFRKFACSSTNSKINMTDTHGNTPLHSMIIRISDMNRCLEAVETLVNAGAATDIRCENGWLPIDHFKTISLRFDEQLEDRGERLLGGEDTKRYLRREKVFLFFSICAFFIIYFWIYVMTAIRMCTQTESTNNLKMFGCIRIKQYVSFAQILVLFFMHFIFARANIIRKAFMLGGFAISPLWGNLYSEQLFVAFSEKLALSFTVLRGVCMMLDQRFPTDVFFNVYCSFLCLFFCMMYLPTPFRNIFRKHHSFCIVTVKTFLILYLVFWITYFLTCDRQYSTEISFHIDISFIDLNSIMASKFLLFFIYCKLFLVCLLRPLLFVLFQPVFWYSELVSNIIWECILLFCIVDILSVPLTMVWYSL